MIDSAENVKTLLLRTQFSLRNCHFLRPFSISMSHFNGIEFNRSFAWKQRVKFTVK